MSAAPEFTYVGTLNTARGYSFASKIITTITSCPGEFPGLKLVVNKQFERHKYIEHLSSRRSPSASLESPDMYQYFLLHKMAQAVS